MKELYRNRIVAYVDILGFSSRVDKTIDRAEKEITEETNLIYEAFQIIRGAWNLDSSESRVKSSKKITIFSDCIVISFRVQRERSGLFTTLNELLWLLMRLVEKGFLCRGAISYGKLYHSNKMVFGPALVEAYTSESKVAQYPRIILNESVLKIGAKYGMNEPIFERESILNILARDTDGMYYIDYFGKCNGGLDSSDETPQYLETLRSIILPYLSKETKIDLRIKYMWMADKFNTVVEWCKDEKVLKHMKHNEDYELWEYYSNLKKIEIP